VPELDPGTLKLLAVGDIERIDHEREHGPELSWRATANRGSRAQRATV
jgi:hypothetical protein